MNTFCRIEVEGEDNAFIENCVEEAFFELKHIENLFSRYLPDSVISKINQEAGSTVVEVDSEVFGLIERAQEISQITSGAFDISLGEAIDFWRLCERRRILPTQNEIETVKTKIGYQNLILDFAKRSIRFAKPGIKIDLGALAKGYGLDRAVRVLKNRGILRAQVNLGGHIYVLDTEPQEIAIRNPLYADEVISTVNLLDTSISTSANYERPGHLLNPLTGYPAQSDILSASVIREDAFLADGLSTAIFVLGFKKASELFKSMKGVEAIIICNGKTAENPKVYKLKGGIVE